MKDYKQAGNSIEYTVPSGGVSAGALVVIGALVGVAASDGAEGDVITVHLEGVYDLPKVSGALTKGQVVYATSTGNITATATDNDLVGNAFEAAASGDNFVAVRLGN